MIATARREWLVVAGGFLVLALVASIWWAIDRRPPEWDHANHLERAVQCSRDIRAGDVRGILERSSFYPPLVLCLAGAGILLGLSDAAAGAGVMIGFLGLGMAAVYLLGRRLAGGTVGVAAALLFGSAPFVVFSTLRFQLDLPLAAMVTLALAVLLATERFTHRPMALAFGVVCGLGMLTKPTFALYVLVPVGDGAGAGRTARPRQRGAGGPGGDRDQPAVVRAPALWPAGAARSARVRAGRRGRASGAAEPGGRDLLSARCCCSSSVSVPACSSRSGSSSPRGDASGSCSAPCWPRSSSCRC